MDRDEIALRLLGSMLSNNLISNLNLSHVSAREALVKKAYQLADTFIKLRDE